jgi:hypothetical protein
MKQIRVAAGILAILTIVVAGLFLLIPGIGMTIIGSSAVAAACLAVVAPFEALEPPARKRVMAGCFAFVVAIGIALGFAVLDGVDLGPVGMLAGLAAAGTALTIWSFAVRNRRRRTLWGDYYDR